MDMLNPQLLIIKTLINIILKLERKNEGKKQKNEWMNDITKHITIYLLIIKRET